MGRRCPYLQATLCRQHNTIEQHRVNMADDQPLELLRLQPGTKLLQHSLVGLLAAWECISKAHTRLLRQLRTCMVTLLHRVATRLPPLLIPKITEKLCTAVIKLPQTSRTLASPVIAGSAARCGDVPMR